jgi:hypothetical protein
MPGFTARGRSGYNGRGIPQSQAKGGRMKLYVVLLGFLYVLQMVLSGWSLLAGVNYLYALGHLGNIVLFSLCLVGAIAQAYGKVLVKLPRTGWWWTGRLTLVLGAYTALLYTRGDFFGLPSPPSGIMHAVLIFLTYVLFAVPVIVYEYELGKQEKGA